MNNGSYRIGKIFGVELRVHWSLLIVLGLVFGFTFLTSGTAGALSTMLLVAGIAVSVVLHELGHIFAARAFGNGTYGITLYPMGGVAQLKRESVSAKEEVLVALAGPAVNVLLAGLAAIPVALFGFQPFIVEFMLINVVLAIFNLIPAYPMDGGRVLRGALWSRYGLFKATWWAARAGQVFAVLFAIVGIYWNPMLLMIAFFVFMQAGAEIARLRLLRANGVWIDGPQGPSPQQYQPWQPDPRNSANDEIWRSSRQSRPDLPDVRYVIRPRDRATPEDSSPWG